MLAGTAFRFVSPVGGGPEALTYHDGGSDDDTGGYAFGVHTGTLDIGTAPSSGQRRFVVLCVLATDGNDDVEGQIISINSTSPTFVADANCTAFSGGARVMVSYLEVASGTTADYQVNFFAAGSGYRIYAFSIYTDDDGLAVRSVNSDTDLSFSVTIAEERAGDLALGLIASTNNGSLGSSSFDTALFNVDVNSDEDVAGWAKSVSALGTNVVYSISDASSQDQAGTVIIFKPALAT